MDERHRPIQRALLEALDKNYPDFTDAAELREIAAPHYLERHIAYLNEHGLVEGQFVSCLQFGEQVAAARITARGLDFLADDGGLGAILGIVTIKLHEDTLKQLVAQKIQESDLSQPEKQRFLDQLRELPGETTKHLALKLVDAGLENWHKALPLLQNILLPS